MAAHDSTPPDVPEWFMDAVEDITPTKRKWIKNLPVISLRSGGLLSAKAWPWIVVTFIHMESEAVRHDLIDLLKRHTDAVSLDAWMAVLLREWMEAETPSRDSWVLPAAGYLGRDATIALLQQAVSKWSKGKERALAVNALDALARIGSKPALEQLATLAAGSRDHVVSDEAKRTMGRKAGAEGKSREQMEDIHVPTCGFNEKGERMLEYGPRSFRVVLSPELHLVLLDREGGRHANAPKPTTTDDPVLAPASYAAWKEIKASFKRVVSAQAKRFEQAMITGRSWSVSEFQQNVLRHPILSRMARLLVWQLVDGNSQNARLTEDHTFACVNDSVVIVSETHQIRLVHPLRLSPDERDRWNDLYIDYRIVQPFPQLTRPVHQLDQAMVSETTLTAPRHAPLKPGVLYGILDSDGWRLGKPESGRFLYSWKCFVADEVTAVIHYSGLLAGAIGKSPEQTITHLSFHAGLMSDEEKDSPGKSLGLGLVPVVAFSEATLRLLRMTSETT